MGGGAYKSLIGYIAFFLMLCYHCLTKHKKRANVAFILSRMYLFSNYYIIYTMFNTSSKTD